ncbi:MAG: hypothetical protein ABI960_01940 [Candidatus Eisenbacteria bacterium]
MDFPRAAVLTAGALVLALALAGCGGGGRTSNDDAREAAELARAKPKSALDVEADRAAATAEAPGAAGPAVLAGDAPEAKQLPADVQEALKGSVEPWLFAWRAALGTFRATELANTGSRALVEDDVVPFDGNAEGQDLRLLYLATPSPGGAVLLDPHLEWTLSGEAGRVRATRGGWPGVEMIDLTTHIRQRVLEAKGPGARIDGAVWLDERRFVVFAAERLVPNPWRGGPVVYLVDLASRRVTRFAGPGCEYRAYREVGSGFDRRFRAGLPGVGFESSLAKN